jgi:glycosyltransferase involved in cell wall biosynthesis
MRKISLVVLTFNRAEVVEKSMEHNISNAGRHIDELVWVDNGSTDGTREIMSRYNPDVTVLNKQNLGVAKGYNRGFALSSGDYIVITGSDMFMPDNWLALFESYLDAVPNTGVACIFSFLLKLYPACIRGDIQTIGGLSLQPALPMGRRILSRELLTTKIGYLREDFGLYGWEDIEWAERAVKVCTQEGLLCYGLPQTAEDQWEGLDFDLSDITKKIVDVSEKVIGPDVSYKRFKQREAADPHKIALVTRCRAEGLPYYNPYGAK